MANRKWPVRMLPLCATGAVVAAFMIFVLFFMDGIIENAIERDLEKIFQARVTITAFHLDLFRFRIETGSTTIADRDSPMRNLFEMGRAGIRLNSLAVLQGKIYIEEIRADALRFGTPRTVSGALPEYEAKRAAAASAPKPEMPPLIDLSKFDAMALINQEYRNLQSLALYDRAISFYAETREKWEGEVSAAEGQIKQVEAAVQPFMNFNAAGLDPRNPEAVLRARALIEDGRTVIETAKTTTAMAQNLVSGVQTDITSARLLVDDARAAAAADLTRLKSFIDFDSGVHREILEPVIRDMLTAQAEQYLNYGRRLLEVLDQVSVLQQKLPKNEKPAKVTFKGRDVRFSSTRYPFFYLGNLASDFTLDGWNWAFSLRDISSEPELTAKPVTLTFAVNEEAGARRGVTVDGSADFRKAQTELFRASIDGRRFPAGISGKFDAVGIGGVSGLIGFDLDSAGGRDGSFSLGGGVVLTGPVIEDARGTVAEAVADAVAAVDAVNIMVLYKHLAAGDDTFTVDTNIGALILDALKRTAERYAAAALAKLETAFRDYIADYTGGKLSGEQLDKILNLARGDLSLIEDIRGGVETKAASIEARISGAVDAAAAEAERRAAEAVDEAKRQAEAEAKRRLEEEARKRLPNLPFGR